MVKWGFILGGKFKDKNEIKLPVHLSIFCRIITSVISAYIDPPIDTLLLGLYGSLGDTRMFSVVYCAVVS